MQTNMARSQFRVQTNNSLRVTIKHIFSFSRLTFKMKLLAIAVIVAAVFEWGHVHASGTNSGVPTSRSLYDDPHADDNIEPYNNTYIVVFKDAASREIIMDGIIRGNRNNDVDSGATRVLADADNLHFQLYDDLHRNTNSNIKVESEYSLAIFDMETLRFGSEEEMQQFVAAHGDNITQVCRDKDIDDGVYFEQQLISLNYYA